MVPRNGGGSKGVTFKQGSDGWPLCGLRACYGRGVSDPLAQFGPATQTWFRQSFAEPTAVQARGWASIAAGIPLTSGGLAIRLAEPDDVRSAPKNVA
jgi:hypothetical protein